MTRLLQDQGLTGRNSHYSLVMAFWSPNETHPRRRLLAGVGPDPVTVSFAAAALAGALLFFGLQGLLFAKAPPYALAVGLAAYAVGAVAASWALWRSYPHSVLGHCNIVTLIRLVLVAVLAVPTLSDVGASWTVLSLGSLALALDGIDGWLARRAGLVSGFGARFDMEVDSALALVLALAAYKGGGAPVAVLVLGLARYAFWGASLGLPWLRATLPERVGRKAVCVLQIAVLIALHLPILPVPLSGPLVLVATLALLWSFGRDVLWLWRARP